MALSVPTAGNRVDSICPITHPLPALFAAVSIPGAPVNAPRDFMGRKHYIRRSELCDGQIGSPVTDTYRCNVERRDAYSAGL
jgi:hypothetical protein